MTTLQKLEKLAYAVHSFYGFPLDDKSKYKFDKSIFNNHITIYVKEKYSGYSNVLELHYAKSNDKIKFSGFQIKAYTTEFPTGELEKLIRSISLFLIEKSNVVKDSQHEIMNICNELQDFYSDGRGEK